MKARWRKQRRRLKRRKHRRKKKLLTKSCSISSSMYSNPNSRKLQKRRRKLRRKRKKLRKNKVQRRRHKMRRHLWGTKTRKAMVKAKGKMTKEDIKKRLKELKKKRAEIIIKHLKYRSLKSKEKRKAIRRLKLSFLEARHRRKKYKRYRRLLAGLAKKKGLTCWRKTRRPKKRNSMSANAITKRAPVNDHKRVEYQRKYQIKPIIYAVDEEFKEKHISKKTKVLFGSAPYELREDVFGNFGKKECRFLNLHPRHKFVGDFRYQDQLHKDKNGSKEAKIWALLNKIGSQNALRVQTYGNHHNLSFVVTTAADSSLSQILKECPKMEIPVCIHIIQQTFYCVRDLHKIGYSHLKINPSAFAVKRQDGRIFVFDHFRFSDTRQNLEKKKKGMPANDESQYLSSIFTERLPENKIDPYMSRRQHFRMVKGTNDDYESWFYVCSRVISSKALEWEKETDHFRMAVAKYSFVKNYSHEDPVVNKKMKTILQYCLASNNRKTKKVAYFIERVIQHWKERTRPPNNQIMPWLDADIERIQMEAADKWLKKNKAWMKPKRPTTCNY